MHRMGAGYDWNALHGYGVFTWSLYNDSTIALRGSEKLALLDFVIVHLIRMNIDHDYYFHSP
jgi:hypothetical protein